MTTTSAATGGKPAGGNGLDRGVMTVASVVVLGAVMSILDVTVVNVAINTLAREFDSPLSTIQWVATGYTLALATVIPLSGWGADRFGTKRLYMISVVLFVLGSLLAGLAWSAGSLIAFRVLQGLGGGLLMPVGMTILTRAAGPQRVGRVMSVIGVPMLLGPIFGPILGGWLVDDFSWRWIFFINAPIGVITLILAAADPAAGRAGAGAPAGLARPRAALPGLALLDLRAGRVRGRGRVRPRLGAAARRRRAAPARRVRPARAADQGGADRPAAVHQPGVQRLGHHADADDHRGVRRDVPAPAVPAGGARRVARWTPACCWPRRASAR